MAQATGISVKKAANGAIKSITFDYEKYGNDLQPLLNKLGFSDASDPYDAEFEKKWATGITGDELSKRVIDRLKQLEWKSK